MYVSLLAPKRGIGFQIPIHIEASFISSPPVNERVGFPFIRMARKKKKIKKRKKKGCRTDRIFSSPTLL